MNEELQKQLLEILRALKDGAPGAWQTLVEQRATYCGYLAINLMVMAVICLVMAWVARRIYSYGAAMPQRKWNYYDEECLASTERACAAMVGGGIGMALALLGAMAFLVGAGLQLAEAAAPLGRMLGSFQ